MTTNINSTFLYFLFIIIIIVIIEASNNVSSKLNLTKREVPKRYLIFPQGSNVQLVYCLTIGTYAKPESFFTVGVTAGLAWELPHKNSVPYRKPAEVYHRRSRRELYRKVELMLSTRGKDGKACVLKALCQAARRNDSDVGKGSFIEEILYSIFTLPGGSYDVDPKTQYELAHDSNNNCDEIYPACSDVFFL
ncbi:uncharacterized protein LOC130671678 [Microplitis mediator]|uniref:uncharacterized protein LOC130671678 n=1 Tax=Microplitis mediator TaxID=375433 RepID=UPI0025568D4E|nr:uncharacterized protein LOC130671678 [Microplitis mediator]